MVEHVARTLCRAASCAAPVCRQCDRETAGGVVAGECGLWETFRAEAVAAIEAVRDHAMLTMRKKRRQRTPLDILSR